jgi:hypothetical protein
MNKPLTGPAARNVVGPRKKRTISLGEFVAGSVRRSPKLGR